MCKEYKKIYVISILLYPILFSYYGGFLSFTLADVLYLPILMVGAYIIVAKKNRKANINSSWFCFFLYFIIYSLFIILINQRYDTLLKHLRYAVYLVSLAIYIPTFFDKDFSIKCIKIISRIIAVFAIIQAIGIYVFHKYIPGLFGFLNLSNTELLDYGTDYSEGILRVSSFFVEPAHLGAYLGCSLVVCLFSGYDSSSKLFSKTNDVLLILIALFFSVSSTAYIMAFFICGLALVEYFKKLKISKNSMITILLLFLICCITLFFISKTSIFTMFVDRTFHGEAKSYHDRTNGYDLIFYNQNVVNRLIGNGFIDNPTQKYIPSIPTLFWNLGTIGCLSYIIIFLKTFRCSRSSLNKMLLVAFIVLGTGTLAYFSYIIMLYFGFINAKDEGV